MRKKDKTTAGNFPVYDSMTQAAGALKVPLRALRVAKRSGCLAFQSNRINSRELLSWGLNQLVANDGNGPGVEHFTKLLVEAKAERERIRLQTDQGKVISKDSVREGVTLNMAKLHEALLRKFCSELPGQLVGLSPLQIKEKSTEAIWAMWDEFRQSLDPLIAPEK